MDNKKFKILAIADAVIIVGLIVVMMILKGNYNDQARSSVKEQGDSYVESVLLVMQEQWKSVDQYGMAWKLVYATLTGDKTEKTFNAAVKAIEADRDARFRQVSYIYTAAGIDDKRQNIISEKAGLADKFLLKDEGGVKEVACGKGCVVSFTFAKGKFKSSDYKALVEYNLANNFKLEAPAEFHFE